VRSVSEVFSTRRVDVERGALIYNQTQTIIVAKSQPSRRPNSLGVAPRAFGPTRLLAGSYESRLGWRSGRFKEGHEMTRRLMYRLVVARRHQTECQCPSTRVIGPMTAVTRGETICCIWYVPPSGTRWCNLSLLAAVSHCSIVTKKR